MLKKSSKKSKADSKKFVVDADNSFDTREFAIQDIEEKKDFLKKLHASLSEVGRYFKSKELNKDSELESNLSDRAKDITKIFETFSDEMERYFIANSKPEESKLFEAPSRYVVAEKIVNLLKNQASSLTYERDIFYPLRRMVFKEFDDKFSLIDIGYDLMFVNNKNNITEVFHAIQTKNFDELNEIDLAKFLIDLDSKIRDNIGNFEREYRLAYYSFLSELNDTIDQYMSKVKKANLEKQNEENIVNGLYKKEIRAYMQEQSIRSYLADVSHGIAVINSTKVEQAKSLDDLISEYESLEKLLKQDFIKRVIDKRNYLDFFDPLRIAVNLVYYGAPLRIENSIDDIVSGEIISKQIENARKILVEGYKENEEIHHRKEELKELEKKYKEQFYEISYEFLDKLLDAIELENEKKIGFYLALESHDVFRNTLNKLQELMLKYLRLQNQAVKKSNSSKLILPNLSFVLNQTKKAIKDIMNIEIAYKNYVAITAIKGYEFIEEKEDEYILDLEKYKEAMYNLFPEKSFYRSLVNNTYMELKNKDIDFYDPADQLIKVILKKYELNYEKLRESMV